LSLRKLFRGLLPAEFQVPSHLPRRLLASTGYFRLRTWVAAHGNRIPDIELYQPLFSPWEGEPAFLEIYHHVHRYTLVSRDRCYLLFKTLQQALSLPGDVIEVGVFRGGTALLEAKIMEAQLDGRRLHLFDSFAGMPKSTNEIDRFEAGDLSRTSAESVRRLLSPYPFVDLHIGFVPYTFDGLHLDRIAWAHIDVDIYQSVKDSIAYVYPRMVPGGYIVFDDYGFPSCASARRAVDEVFHNLREVPLCLPTGQCLVVKLESDSRFP
jgi:O-methyltransferase